MTTLCATADMVVTVGDFKKLQRLFRPLAEIATCLQDTAKCRYQAQGPEDCSNLGEPAGKDANQAQNKDGFAAFGNAGRAHRKRRAAVAQRRSLSVGARFVGVLG